MLITYITIVIIKLYNLEAFTVYVLQIIGFESE